MSPKVLPWFYFTHSLACYSVHKVMLELKNMDFEMPYSHSQLLDGNGDAVCEVLEFLTKKVLEG